MRRNSKASMTAAVALLSIAAAVAPSPAAAAKKKSCTRGDAKLEAVSGDVRVVRATGKRQSTHETRRENLYACWAKTGKRILINAEVDSGLDNIASTRVEIVQERYVGVAATNTGGVSESTVARVYDARKSKRLHTSAECDKVDLGDFGGVEDVAFLDGGGMAMTCRRLLVYRNATAPLETLEPAGTDVRQIGVSRYTRSFGQRLFWTVLTGDTETTKSLLL